MATSLHFLEEFIADPVAVASPVPSGRVLANAVAGQIPAGARRVLELGPGTGAVTQAILARGAEPAGVAAIEYSVKFAALLRERFPGSRILHGDAFGFDRLLQFEGIGGPFDAIVSGVPVLNRSRRVRRRLLLEAMNWLRPGAPFIQYSYALTSPYPDCAGVAREHAARVWRNIPPLHVWVYRHKGD